MDRHSDDFVKLLTSNQTALYGCIFSLLPDRAVAHDVLQETNLTLWHKAEDFEPGTNFLAWASRVARYHVLNYRRAKLRDRHVFNDEIFNSLCERQELAIDDFSNHAEALKKCLKKLPPQHVELITERYTNGESVRQMAESRGQSAGAISQMLFRIRESLLNCVALQLRGGIHEQST